MPKDNYDINAMMEEASPDRFRDRTRGKSRYIRKALVKLGRMTPAEFASYKPLTMFEEMARNIVSKAAYSAKNDVSNALKQITEALGESAKASSQAKETDERPDFSIALPRPDRTQVDAEVQ